jgi:pimeloyl-ACP methyl ester carboxylesterase
MRWKLLVHGGMGQIESWQSLWGTLAGQWRVTAMDRRGRGTSGDIEPYDISREFQDVAAVAASLGGPVDVFGHSFGATCALGAAAMRRRCGGSPCMSRQARRPSRRNGGTVPSP